MDVPLRSLEKKHVAVQAGIEIGFERFLEEKNYQAIVTHFADPGLPETASETCDPATDGKGYGFGGEGGPENSKRWVLKRWRYNDPESAE